MKCPQILLGTVYTTLADALNSILTKNFMEAYEVKYFRIEFSSNYYICNFTKDDDNWYHGTAHSLQGNRQFLVTRYVEKLPLPGCTVTELVPYTDQRFVYTTQDRIAVTNYDVEMRSDSEGGNITLRSQNKSQVWEIDAFDNNALRILNLTKGGYFNIKNDGSLDNVTITDLYNKYNSLILPRVQLRAQLLVQHLE